MGSLNAQMIAASVSPRKDILAAQEFSELYKK